MIRCEGTGTRPDAPLGPVVRCPVCGRHVTTSTRGLVSAHLRARNDDEDEAA